MAISHVSLLLNNRVQNKGLNIAGVHIDALISESHSAPVSLTTNPIETGMRITDSTVVEPVALRLKGAVSNIRAFPLRIQGLDPTQFGIVVPPVVTLALSARGNRDRERHAKAAWEALHEARRLRQRITVHTTIKSYSNMMITNITADKQASNAGVLVFDVHLSEVLVVSSSQVREHSAYAARGAQAPRAATDNVINLINTNRPGGAIN